MDEDKEPGAKIGCIRSPSWLVISELRLEIRGEAPVTETEAELALAFLPEGSAMMRLLSKSGNISGPNELIESATSRATCSRRSRSLTNVFALDGLRDNVKGRSDLKMSMPISPNRKAAKVMAGKMAYPSKMTDHHGIHSGT